MPSPRICPMRRLLLVVGRCRSVCQRDRGRQAGLLAHDAGRVPLARQVLRQGHVPRPITMLRSVAEADFDFTRRGPALLLLSLVSSSLRSLFPFLPPLFLFSPLHLHFHAFPPFL